MEFLKRFEWTDTLLTQTERQAVEVILVAYNDIFARHEWLSERTQNLG